MSDQNLKLNSLSRYSKQSPNFILEEYSQCEVPAGCGGVVLRWRNPNVALPLLVKLYAVGKYKAYLDGDPITVGRPLVPFGEHVLAIEISGTDQRYVALVCTATYDEAERDGVRRSRDTGQKVQIATAADGTWKYTTLPPTDDVWKRPEFDDSTWSAMVPKNAWRPPTKSGFDQGKWEAERMAGARAIPIGFNEEASRIWVRRRFHLHRREEPESE